ncbi:hypothetical protein DT075_26495 [Bacillus licheniformis]|nr:hypothetical protein DT075_26495 [Bacillus licheniformis]
MGMTGQDKREIFDFIDDAPQIVRPANFPEGTPGKGITYIKTNGSKELAVINLQGRTFLPAIDCPFRKADELTFIGDVVGSPGRDMIKTYLPKLKLKYKPNAVIVNGENAAHGKGITEKIYHQLIQAGADVLTMGNHTYA